MAAAGLATMTMAASAATSDSRSLLIELLPTVRDAAPAREPRCPVPLSRAVGGVCAYRVGSVEICAGSGRLEWPPTNGPEVPHRWSCLLDLPAVPGQRAG